MFEVKDGTFRTWSADIGFLQLWVLQDFLFKVTRKWVNPLWSPLPSWSGGGTRDQILPKYSQQSKERKVLPPERSDSHGASPGRYRWRGRAHDHFRKLGKPVGLWKRQANRGRSVKAQSQSTDRFFLFKREISEGHFPSVLKLFL